MHHEDIKAAIRKRDVTPSDVAKALRVSNSLVSRVIRGKSRSERVARAIAKVTGLGIDVLWPGLYQARGDGTQRVAGLLRAARQSRS